MGQTIELTGMVLSAIPVGDYDKRILLLTRERGKIAAFMRGARRPNSAFLAASNPFSFGQFEVFEGKSSYNVAKVSISHHFRELAQDLDAVSYGFYFLEIAAYYTQENMDGTEFLNLLYVSLKALLKPEPDNRLVRRVYELRMLVLSGEYPDVFSCVKCGKKQELYYFSIKCHGVLCPECLKGEYAAPLDESTLYALQYIMTAPYQKLYPLHQYHDRHFKSQEMLEHI